MSVDETAAEYRLATGEMVQPMTVRGDGGSWFLAVKDGKNYKLYISYGNKTLYKMHLEGELLPGTYGE